MSPMSNDNAQSDVAELQATLARAGSPWVAGATTMSQLSDAEKHLRLGYVPGPGEPTLEAREQLATAQYAELGAAGIRAVGAPAVYDLRNVGGKNFISPIVDQGNCGSCVSFGACATVEGTARVTRNDPNFVIDMSEAHLFYCHARTQGRRCGGANGGWWVPPALDAFKNIGVADEACYPYAASDQDCTNLCTDWQNRVTKIKSWTALSAAPDMKTWLSIKGPLAACFTVYDDFFDYRSGVYRHVSGAFAGGHCISVVGYDDNQQCWICKNSWGSGWGETGYFRIQYGQVGIDQTMWGVEVAAPLPDTNWYNNTRITGLWANPQERNAWAYLDTIGWRRIAPDSEAIYLSLLTLLATAKGTNCPVNVRLEGGLIKEVYVL